MKRIKLFEEVNSCLIQKSDIEEMIREYLEFDYLEYFEDDVKKFKRLMGDANYKKDCDIFDALEYFDNPDVQNEEDGVEFNGEYSMLQNIRDLIEFHARKLMPYVVGQILKEKLDEEPANYVKHKELYQRYSAYMDIPEDVKRAGKAGLLDLEK